MTVWHSLQVHPSDIIGESSSHSVHITGSLQGSASTHISYCSLNTHPRKLQSIQVMWFALKTSVWLGLDLISILRLHWLSSRWTGVLFNDTTHEQWHLSVFESHNANQVTRFLEAYNCPIGSERCYAARSAKHCVVWSADEAVCHQPLMKQTWASLACETIPSRLAQVA